MNGEPEGQKSHTKVRFPTEPLGPESNARGQQRCALPHREIAPTGTERVTLNGANGHASVTRYDEP
jgi:hypothetical protein